MKNGKGEIHYTNGDVFTGEFLDDEMHGVGYWQYSSKNSQNKSNKNPKDKLVKKMYVKGEEVEIVESTNDKKKNSSSSCCIIF